MANTTFRRNYPAAARQLRSDNRQLPHDLDIAAGVIQRLTLENHPLRQQLEDAAKVTRIVPAPRRG